jgi:hypothetical protein
MTDTYVGPFSTAKTRIPSGLAGNLVAIDSGGELVDSGVAPTIDPLSNDNSHIPTTEAMQSAILAGVTAGYTFQGEWDASGGTYPTLDHLGAPIKMGDNWRITVAGILPGGKNVYVGDNLLALIDAPGQTAGNWSVSIGTGVRQFNGRDGLVLPESDDYAFSQISGTVNLASQASGILPNANTTAEEYSGAGNTPNSIVKRDSFGTLQADISTSSSLASQIGVSPDSSDTVAYPLFANNLGPSFQGARTNTGYQYNATTNTLTVNVSGYATTSAMNTALALKSDINSPNFTGTPTTPNVSAGDNSTKLANTNYIDSALSTFNNINGLRLSWASATTLGLTSGYWSVAGSSIIRTNAAVTINIANVGVVNGLDSGAAANNTNYYVYAIAHGTTPALNGAILSTNSTTPTLPSGYTAFRYIGRVRRSGSAAFIRFNQCGTGTKRTTTYTDTATNTRFLSGGSATSFTAISMASFVPPGCTSGVLHFEFSAGDQYDMALSIRETGSSIIATETLVRILPGVYDFSTEIAPFICDTSQSIDYVFAPSGAGNISVLSYDEDL